jgi:hypothetical protein
MRVQSYNLVVHCERIIPYTVHRDVEAHPEPMRSANTLHVKRKPAVRNVSASTSRVDYVGDSARSVFPSITFRGLGIRDHS